jgi:uncharacterized protein (TIGR02453 family)
LGSGDGGFSGFPRDGVVFFEELKKNNEKEWFDRHKDRFQTAVMSPARAFVSAMGERLRAISPGVVADPRVNKSIFRINRDTRFSLDKSPYKTHLGIFFWEGRRPKMECSGYYFHLEPPRLMLGAGIYMFPRQLIHPFRTAAVDPDHGDRLAEIVETLKKKSRYEIGGVHYKRMPPGYDQEHPNAPLLLHNGLYVGSETEIPEELFSERLLGYCMKVFTDLHPLHQWLVEFGERMSGR